MECPFYDARLFRQEPAWVEQGRSGAIAMVQHSGSDSGVNPPAPGALPLDEAAARLAQCADEPIHIPGAVQPHGLLLVLTEPSLTILQASDNARSICGRGAESLLGKPLDLLLEHRQIDAVRQALQTPADSATVIGKSPLYLLTAVFQGRHYQALFHRADGLLLIDLEPAERRGETIQNLHPLMRGSICRLEAAGDLKELCRLAAVEVRRVAGFDRVMIYRFDAGWNGQVVAESKADDLPPFIGLHYPASDIPAQARELYRSNRLRLIADVGYLPSRLVPPINPLTGRPTDLSHSTLRSVSPVHMEYLRNMGVKSSMSVSILIEEPIEPDGSNNDRGGDGGGGDRGGDGGRRRRLWGLIACHHRTPLYVGYEARTACEFVGQVLGLQVWSQEMTAKADRRIRLQHLLTRLLQHMAGADQFFDGLALHPDDLLRYAAAQGAAICFQGRCILLGSAPSNEQVSALVEWLAEVGGEGEAPFHTDCLSARFPPAADYKRLASGVLATSISRLHHSYLIWFRPEVMQTVAWAGATHKPAAPDWDGRLHPRTSFELWKQTVRDKSLPWDAVEVSAAAELRDAVVRIVLRRAEELAQLSDELERSNQQLQRTNQELEAFSYSVSHDLQAPFRHIVGYADLLQRRIGAALDETARRYVATITDSACFAGKLVDSLLSFSQMGRASLRPAPVDMNALVQDLLRELRVEAGERAVRWEIHPLPSVWADPLMLRLAMRNLLANALKYTRPRPLAIIEVGRLEADDSESPPPGEEPAEAAPHRDLAGFFVRDNGVGFDMAYAFKLFGVFQRLHRAEEFEGTGIGLANVKRIIERHGGRAWGQGTVGAGATFFFTLPTAAPAEPSLHQSQGPSAGV